MPKKMDKKGKAVNVPDVNHLAQAIYDENYANAYKSREEIYPHIRRQLKELAKVEAQLECLAIMDQNLQNKGEDIFMMEGKNGVFHQHPHRKWEKSLRSEYSKLIKSLNLSLDKKTAMKAERSEKVNEILKDL